MGKIRILHVLWDDDYGGVERHVLDLLTNLDPSVFDFELCILHEDRNRITKAIREKGIPIHHMYFKSGFDFLGTIRFIRFIRHRKYDVIHGHTHPLWMQIAVRSFTRSLVIVRLHGRDVVEKSSFRSLFLSRISRFFTDGYISPSKVHKKTTTDLYSINPDKIHVLHHGINFSHFHVPTLEERTEKRKELDLKDDDFAIGNIGRLAEQKNYPCFIRTAVRIHEEMPNTKFFIVGVGELEEELKRMVCDNNAEDYVIFLGRRSDIAQLLGAWDLFLFTTWIESFGLVVLEAMANEIPIVLTNSSSLPEVVGDTAVLVEPDDDSSFARETVELLRDDNRRERMTKEARKRAIDLFSMKHMIDTMSDIYIKLVTDKKKA